MFKSIMLITKISTIKKKITFTSYFEYLQNNIAHLAIENMCVQS